MIWANSDSPFTAIGVAEDEIGCLVLIETRKMTSSELRQRLLGREPVFGTLIVSSSPQWLDVIRGCGLDFVFIDAEHIAID